LATLFLALASADDSAKDNIARIRAGDRLYVHATKGLPNSPIAIKGVYKVEPSGKLPLGPGYERVQVTGLTPEEAEVKVRDSLAKFINKPSVSLTWYDPVAHGTLDLLDRVTKLEREVVELQTMLTKRGFLTGPR
jgi:protein involved in polysaccharide export with SLBB domain